MLSPGTFGTGTAGGAGSALAMPPVNKAIPDPTRTAVVDNTLLIRDIALPIPGFAV
jgi:hypothetical protein